MSSAFVIEGDDMWLYDIAPTMQALLNYLRKENGGLPVTLKKEYRDELLKVNIYKMSDGFSYTIKDNKWVCLD